MRDGQGAGGRARRDIWAPSHSDLCPRVCLDSQGTQAHLPSLHARQGLFSPVSWTQTRAPAGPSSGQCLVPLTLQEREPGQQEVNPPPMWVPLCPHPQALGC